jgi:hypothetical protein
VGTHQQQEQQQVVDQQQQQQVVDQQQQEQQQVVDQQQQEQQQVVDQQQQEQQQVVDQQQQPPSAVLCPRLITVQLSDNIFEGATGCHEWDAGFVCGEFVAQHQQLFQGKLFMWSAVWVALALIPR